MLSYRCRKRMVKGIPIILMGVVICIIWEKSYENQATASPREARSDRVVLSSRTVAENQAAASPREARSDRVVLPGPTVAEIVLNTETSQQPLPGIAGDDVINTNEALKHLPGIPGDDVDSSCTRHYDNDTVHIVIFADEDLFIGAMTLANSIFRNTQSDLMFHFVTFPSDVSFLKEWLKIGDLRHLSYEIIEFPRDGLEGKFKVRSGEQYLASPLNFARLYLPDLLPCLGRVIFIDADCLVLGDISELYHTYIAPNHVIAALNKCDFEKYLMLKRVMNDSNHYIQEAQLPLRGCMMNAGVFVADLGKWEQQHVTQDLEYWMELNTREPVFMFGNFGAGSQAVMNAVLHSRFTAMPMEWNISIRYRLDCQKTKPGEPTESEKT